MRSNSAGSRTIDVAVDAPRLESSSAIARQLAQALPDTPGWVDIRGMLLSTSAVVSGGATVDESFVVRAMSGALSVVGVVGTRLTASLPRQLTT